MMTLLTRTLRDPFSDADALRRARYGVIEVRDGRLAAIHLRPWPKVISALEIAWLGRRFHSQRKRDRLLVYYNQPRRFPNYLALNYVLSERRCTLATLRVARAALDEIARIKSSDAILCDAWNARISARLLARWGWEPHRPARWHRHYIKRFYGVYPPPAAWHGGVPASSVAESALVVP